MSSELVNYNGEPPKKKYRPSLVSDAIESDYIDETDFAQYIDTSSFDFTGESDSADIQSLKDDNIEFSEKPTKKDLQAQKSAENTATPLESETLENVKASEDHSDTELPEHDDDVSDSREDKKDTASSKKRTRATAEQLSILEETFLTNTSPNSKVREALAERVKMSERSIQIWFQNRRAKVKLMQKRSHMLQEEAFKQQYLSTCMAGYNTNLYPFRMGMAPYPNGRVPLPRSNTEFIPPNIPRASPVPHPSQHLGVNMSGYYPPQYPGQIPIGYSPQPFMAGQDHIGGSMRERPTMMVRSMSAPTTPNAASTDGCYTFSCDTLGVGSWRRMSITSTDLICFFNTVERKMTWQIMDNNARFKLEFPFTAVVGLEYQTLDAVFSQLAIDISQTPSFYMEVKSGNGHVWTPCRDFTEGKQASRFFRHVIKGHSQPLKSQLVMLMQADPNLQRVTQIDAPGSTLSSQMIPERPQSFPVVSSTDSHAANIEFASRRAISVPMLNMVGPGERPRAVSMVSEMGQFVSSEMTPELQEQLIATLNQGSTIAIGSNMATPPLAEHDFNQPSASNSPIENSTPTPSELVLTSPLSLYQNALEQSQYTSSAVSNQSTIDPMFGNLVPQMPSNDGLLNYDHEVYDQILVGGYQGGYQAELLNQEYNGQF
ncbi:hypothetical protein K7432_008489 [Basidiobolus ranarum]|uniref:Homeobox domain-containing protein n=1 Tax=Basidiobolus ranarum TaxID=34480 RepID=A0ABR2WRQ7_9FUNG